MQQTGELRNLTCNLTWCAPMEMRPTAPTVSAALVKKFAQRLWRNVRPPPGPVRAEGLRHLQLKDPLRQVCCLHAGAPHEHLAYVKDKRN